MSLIQPNWDGYKIDDLLKIAPALEPVPLSGMYAGIYVIVDYSGHVYYVGTSRAVYSRISQHAEVLGEIHAAYAAPVPNQWRLVVEGALIRETRAPANFGLYGPRGTYRIHAGREHKDGDDAIISKFLCMGGGLDV